MSAKIIPWPDRLPEDPSKIAAVLGDIVTALENHRPAFIKLGGLGIRDTRRRYALGEIHNIAYELRQLCRAFGVTVEDAQSPSVIHK